MSEETNKEIVLILTKYLRITGNIGLLPGVRLTDFMNETKDFLAVTEAEVLDRASGNKVLAGGFLNVQRSHIEVVIPAHLEILE